MLFNSLSFALFFPVVFALYWMLNEKGLRMQNMLLLLASFFFYGSWDYRFMFLLLFSIGLDYYSGIRIHEAVGRRHKLIWLWTSIGINLGFLAIFKYYNFFAQSTADLLSLFGMRADIALLDIILPVGISFYTFHGVSYIIDIYNDRIVPERNFVNYAVFVSFFPLLVAGPIERATHLLPQLQRKREFSSEAATDGLRRLLWGLFKKVVIADNCADYANQIFNNPAGQNGVTLFMGALFFTFQIYCDFSGYSDIALGTAKMLGIDLLQNFNYPYFSRDIAEFWRRWHISLSSWFRDYLYIPLGGSRGSRWKKIRNTFIIFIVSGFWHGANWTFIAWGALNACYFIPLLLAEKNRNNLDTVARGRYLPNFREAASMLLTFLLTVLAWVFFRAATMHDAFTYLGGVFTRSWSHPPDLDGKAAVILTLTGLFFLVEWIGREHPFALHRLDHRVRSQALRWSIYASIITMIILLTGKEQQFIYFQF